MRRSLALLGLATALAACGPNSPTDGLRGVSSVNVPVVSRADYAFDVAAPDGSLPSSEAARLDAWFRSLQLGYGDSIYIDGPAAYGARDDIARVAGQYGLLVNNGAPVTPGAVPIGAVRVVVSRTRASVPNCPNWSIPSQPNLENKTMSNFGCGVNSNLAAMVANPEDLIYGREGSGIGDTQTASKAVQSYRKAPPTGASGLKDISTKGN
ncbi:MAG: CpaD family pilus assembly protein [Sphingomonas sp.]|uniref:CpaD family pilus assembly protein n=1 Tax=Sphingomonas sp. TaxID=28214 RepID=UPI0017D5AA14|nr:CpaD family pilus assembly protein [Sphingomonas sp.]MBA3668151.1 CpaD family pilus assembly protein [Sphingomonas sp.]